MKQENEIKILAEAYGGNWAFHWIKLLPNFTDLIFKWAQYLVVVLIAGAWSSAVSTLSIRIVYEGLGAIFFIYTWFILFGLVRINTVRLRAVVHDEKHFRNSVKYIGASILLFAIALFFTRFMIDLRQSMHDLIQLS